MGHQWPVAVPREIALGRDPVAASFPPNLPNSASSAMAKELHSLGVLCTSAPRGEMTASDEARRWRSSPQRVSPGTVTTGTHAATPPRNRCVGAAAEGSRPTGDRCTLGTPDDRQAASRVSGAAVHVRTQSSRQ